MLRQESKLKRRLDNLYHKLLAISTSQNPHEVAVSKKHKDSLDYVFFWRAIILNSICIADKEILYRYSNVYLTTTESKISTSPSIVAHGLDVYKPLCMFDLKAKCSDNVRIVQMATLCVSSVYQISTELHLSTFEECNRFP